MPKNHRRYFFRALRDESDKDGMRIVMELNRGELADVILNNLYKHTPMESVFVYCGCKTASRS